MGECSDLRGSCRFCRFFGSGRGKGEPLTGSPFPPVSVGALAVVVLDRYGVAVHGGLTFWLVQSEGLGLGRWGEFPCAGPSRNAHTQRAGPLIGFFWIPLLIVLVRLGPWSVVAGGSCIYVEWVVDARPAPVVSQVGVYLGIQWVASRRLQFHRAVGCRCY